MSKFETHLKYEQFDFTDNGRQAHRKRPFSKKRGVRNGGSHPIDLKQMDDGVESWVPSYAKNLDPLHHERQWIIDSLGAFYLDQVIGDVTRIVKGGKEANVYCCTGHPRTGEPLIAAKLYRPRMLRNLKNDAIYKAGRQLRDDQGDDLRGRRERVALRKKTNFGKKLDFDQWIGTEYRVLSALYEAGADVPKPIAYQNNALLMAYIGDRSHAAPALNEISLTPEEARPLFEQTLDNVGLMLQMGWVHGDLSAYNILYWNGRIWLIDFPQIVNVYKNRYAYDILARDVQRVCDYFGKYGVEGDAKALTLELWESLDVGGGDFLDDEV